MKTIYLAHPYSDDRARNWERALRWYHYFLVHHEVVVVADWMLCVQVLDETHRDFGFQANAELIKRVDEVWLCGGHISRGMRAEARLGFASYKPVLDFTCDYGLEPPKSDIVLGKPMFPDHPDLMEPVA
jgi:hypothetical protein